MRKYELCEIYTPQRPVKTLSERSKLYSLEPIALNTGMSEGLISWITRLSSLYRSTNEELMRAILRENLHIKIDLRSSHNYFRRSNGMNEWSNSLVSLLEQLTFRNDLSYLTALPYSQSVTEMYLMRQKHRCWCPACFEHWVKEGVTLYEPLFWSFAISKICPVHLSTLQDTCRQCKKQMYPYSVKQQIGYCDYCKSWLGETDTHVYTQSDVDYQLFVVKSLCDIIAHAPKMNSLPIKNRSKALFSRLTYQFTDGKKKTFAKMCRLNSGTMRNYILGESLPGLYNLINISYTVNIPAFDLLFCDLESSSQTFNSEVKINTNVLRLKKINRLDQKKIDTIQKRLDNILLHADSIVTITQICQEFSISQPTFINFFPEQRTKLIELNKALLNKEKEQRMSDLILFVQQITEELYNSGIYPSYRSVVDKCNKMSFSQELRNVWRNKLIELGVVERVNQFQ